MLSDSYSSMKMQRSKRHFVPTLINLFRKDATLLKSLQVPVFMNFFPPWSASWHGIRKLNKFRNSHANPNRSD